MSALRVRKGQRWQHLPATRGRYLCARPRRPFAVRCRGFLLDHARLLMAVAAIGLVVVGLLEATR